MKTTADTKKQAGTLSRLRPFWGYHRGWLGRGGYLPVAFLMTCRGGRNSISCPSRSPVPIIGVNPVKHLLTFVCRANAHRSSNPARSSDDRLLIRRRSSVLSKWRALEAVIPDSMRIAVSAKRDRDIEGLQVEPIQQKSPPPCSARFGGELGERSSCGGCYPCLDLWARVLTGNRPEGRLPAVVTEGPWLVRISISFSVAVTPTSVVLGCYPLFPNPFGIRFCFDGRTPPKLLVISKFAEAASVVGWRARLWC